jgi:hypothetical protein
MKVKNYRYLFFMLQMVSERRNQKDTVIDPDPEKIYPGSGTAALLILRC